MATMVGRTGRVLAFEPDPRNCDVLKLNIRTHYMSDLVIPFNKALLDRNAEIRFYSTLAGGHSHVHYSYPESTNSLFPTNYDLALAAESEILVEAVRAGDILKKMGLKPDFVRLDVQGAEPEALDGMWEYLEGASETMILFEYAPICLKLAGHDSPTDFVHRLAGLGMKFHRIEPDGSLKLVDAESLKLVQDDQVEDYVAARQPL
jgi:FkbM family methyltransferase